MSERISVQEVTYTTYRFMEGVSPVVAILGWLPPNKILLGRENQRWMITIEEIPTEK